MKNKQIKKIFTVAVAAYMMTALAACGDNAVEAGSNNVKAETTTDNADMADAGPGSEEAVTLEESVPALEKETETAKAAEEAENVEESDADSTQEPETPSNTPATSPKPSAEPKESAKPAESTAGTGSTVNGSTTAQSTQASPKPSASAQPAATPATPAATPQATPAHTHSWNPHYITVVDVPAWSEDQYVDFPHYEERWVMNGYPYLDVTDWSYDQRIQWNKDHGIGQVDENGFSLAGQYTSCFATHNESVVSWVEQIWVGTIEHPAVTHQEIDYYTCSCGETKK